MLIARNSDGAAAAEKFDRLLETFTAVEHLDPSPAAQTLNVPIDKTIVQLLVNVSISDVTDDAWQDMSEQLHRSKVTQDHDHSAPSAQVPMQQIEVFYFDAL